MDLTNLFLEVPQVSMVDIHSHAQALDPFLLPYTETRTHQSFLQSPPAKHTPRPLHFPVADGTKHKEISPKYVSGDRAQKKSMFTFSLCEQMQHLLSHQPQQSLLKMYIDEVSFRTNS